MWGVIPAAGAGSRIQPLAFSKELLPVGSRADGDVERPRAVSEYLVERMAKAGVDHLCFVISPGKSDILEYYGNEAYGMDVCYVVQTRPEGLCDALFRPASILPADEPVVVGLPDTVWFPDDGLTRLDLHTLSFLLFPVDNPGLFDAVVTDDRGRVREIQVKRPDATTRWVWGAFGMPGTVYHDLRELWLARAGEDEYFGTLVNAWLERGGRAMGVRAGEAYVDVGTVNGYREAIRLLERGGRRD